MINYLKDSLTNLMSGLGGTQDKSTYNQYAFTALTQAQLEAAYRGDWIARKAVDIPAQDATREWRIWQAEKEQISAIEAIENKFLVQNKVREGVIKGRLYGGGGLVLGVDGTGEMSEPLNLDAVKKDSLRYIHAVSRYDLSTGGVDRDVESIYFGTPKYYMINSSSGSLTIHPSRVCRFVSKKIPNEQLNTDGWGDGIIQSIDQAIKNGTASPQIAAAMMEEACTDVVKIPGLMDGVSTAEYRAKVIERFQLAKLGQSIVRTKIMDSEEEWDKQQINFSQIPEMVSLYLRIAAAAADIPATRMLGQAPGGLNATGDGDTRNYYDNVSDTQKTDIQPSIYMLDEVMIRSALGERPEEIHYNWAPLWQPTETEKADIFLKRSQAIANIFNTGYVPMEAMGISVQNMLIEGGDLPGLEQALKDLPEIDEDDQEVKEQFEQGKKVG